MKITVFYVGSSLLAPLKQAEREINREHALDLKIAAYNFGAPLTDDEWSDIERDLEESEVVFAIHVMDGENAMRLIAALERYKQTHRAVIVINCMPDLMRRTRMGRLNAGKLFQTRRKKDRSEKWKRRTKRIKPRDASIRNRRLMGRQASARTQVKR